MTTNQQAALFQLVKETVLPHYCAFCRAPSTGREEFVDGQLSLDYEGVIYICMDCARQIARLIGFTDDNYYDQYVEKCKQVESLNERINFKSDKLAVYDSLVGRIDNVRDFVAAVDEIKNLQPKSSNQRVDVSQKKQSGPFE